MKNNIFLLSKESFKNDGNVCVKKTVLNSNYPIHCHDFYEIEMVINGQGKQNLNGKTYALKKGDAYIIRPTDFHSMEINDSLTVYNIMFDDILLSSSHIFNDISSLDSFYSSFDDEDFEKMVPLFSLLAYETAEKSEMYTTVQKNLIECIMINIIRKSKSCVYETQDLPLQQVLNYIHNNFTLSPTLEKAAGAINFTPAYFSQWFHKATGKTYIEYLNSLKLSYAKKLLMSSEMSVTEICFESGFNSVSNFLKEFKRKFSQTPSAFRKGLITEP